MERVERKPLGKRRVYQEARSVYFLIGYLRLVKVQGTVVFDDSCDSRVEQLSIM